MRRPVTDREPFEDVPLGRDWSLAQLVAVKRADELMAQRGAELPDDLVIVDGKRVRLDDVATARTCRACSGPLFAAASGDFCKRCRLVPCAAACGRQALRGAPGGRCRTCRRSASGGVAKVRADWQAVRVHGDVLHSRAMPPRRERSRDVKPPRNQRSPDALDKAVKGLDARRRRFIGLLAEGLDIDAALRQCGFGRKRLVLARVRVLGDPSVRKAIKRICLGLDAKRRARLLEPYLAQEMAETALGTAAPRMARMNACREILGWGGLAPSAKDGSSHPDLGELLDALGRERPDAGERPDAEPPVPTLVH